MAQVGIQSGGALRDHDHTASGAGGQLNPETALNPRPRVDFGDGSDGSVSVPAGITTLTRDMSYENLTLPAAGGDIMAAGFKIRVRGKLTIGAGRFIFANEAADAGGAGAAGVGGAGGSLAITNRRPSLNLPTPGTAGGNGGGLGAATAAGGDAPAPALAADVALLMGRFWAGGGGGGGGGVGVAPTAGGTPVRPIGGARGGNGGDGAYAGPGNCNMGGGGGGAGGGLLEIWANEIDNVGALYAAGGVGGTGQSVVIATAGGGGGGGGGCCLVFYKTASGAGVGTMLVNGGAGGASGGGVADGQAGEAGFSYSQKIGA